MDKHRAQIEIESLFWGKEEKTIEEIRDRLSNILQELHSMNDEVECNNCGNLIYLIEDESIYVCYNSECTSCYEEYEEESKKETLEEAAEIAYQKSLKDDLGLSFYDGVKFATEYQQEKMYSEEEVLNILHNWSMYKVDIEINNLGNEFQDILPYYEWFERYKKKQNK